MSSDSAAPVASFLDGFAKTRAGLTAPGAPFELVELTDAEGQSFKAFKNAFPHLPTLLNAGRAHGAKEFIVQEGDRWSFDRLFAAADALAETEGEGKGESAAVGKDDAGSFASAVTSPEASARA